MLNVNYDVNICSSGNIKYLEALFNFLSEIIYQFAFRLDLDPYHHTLLQEWKTSARTWYIFHIHKYIAVLILKLRFNAAITRYEFHTKIQMCVINNKLRVVLQKWSHRIVTIYKFSCPFIITHRFRPTGMK